ncbi:MAG TPA: condensation domain-containing protein, partial [Ktedonobacteraceae bacterium]|nr:condensation domain-containing protein [Ktedonobacteraceae bacterium]
MQAVSVQVTSLSRRQTYLWKWLHTGQIEDVRCMYMLEGMFDPGHFQQAFQQCIENYDILRVTFSVLPGMDIPVQIADYNREIPCPLVSLEGLDAAIQRSILDTNWQNLQHYSFDLEQGPLLNALLVRLDACTHLLLLSCSAMCADICTLKHLVSKLFYIYAAFESGERYSYEEDVLQYEDVSSWQQELLASESAMEQQELWRAFDLANMAALPLPLLNEQGNGQHGPVHSLSDAFPVQKISVALDESFQQHLHALSDRIQVSTEVCLLTCWQILLWRLTDVAPLIGVACDGRPYEELITAPGPHSRNIPFTLSLDGKMSFERTLARTSVAMQKMKENQLYFDWEALAHEAELQEHLFPLAFSYEVWPAQWQAGSLLVRVVEQAGGSEPSQLHLQAIQLGEQVHLHLQYQPAAFSAHQARRLTEALETVLPQLLSAPARPVQSLTLLSLSQQQQQVQRLRGPQRAWPLVPLHQLF